MERNDRNRAIESKCFHLCLKNHPKFLFLLPICKLHPKVFLAQKKIFFWKKSLGFLGGTVIPGGTFIVIAEFSRGVRLFQTVPLFCTIEYVISGCIFFAIAVYNFFLGELA